MRLKYFLRGLGTGILLTALILCISYRSDSSGADVVEQAKELGMVFPKGTERPIEEILVTAEPEENVPDAQAGKDAVGSGAGVTGEESGATKKPEAKKTSKPTQKAASKPTKKPSGTTAAGSGRKFTVRGGLLSSSVAREMKQAGIIKDDDAFDEYLEKSGNARKVRAGTYKIPVGASYEEIARIITRQDG